MRRRATFGGIFLFKISYFLVKISRFLSDSNNIVTAQIYLQYLQILTFFLYGLSIFSELAPDYNKIIIIIKKKLKTTRDSALLERSAPASLT
ncbi:hypothetical protein GDO81_019151 [Engystomops pustulosus]|uniref:Uncharacterized protein n=1 Tax=Engystomops pustulosus TaxID=76066 RepID=A0AAV6YZG3_ENGPU|nr:hypothetical protein GDO81_019151 [Engystomops pustulosus]